MKLPGAHRCIVERQKIVDYLLNAAHPDNGGKADFFSALGFEISSWQLLANALRQLVISAEVSASIESVHGQKFVVDGPVQGTAGQIRGVRTVWIVDAGTEVPRLVTAYPHESPEAP